ncbi:MAG: hypothetical protein ACTSX6_06670 [Candidatus Heimdallarchaeaceae archaeon]
MRKINFKVLNSFVFTFLILVNFSLYSISITVEAGTDPLNQDDYPLTVKNNLGLIIGLSVTGVVIVFAGVALYILKKKGLLTKILSRFK